MSFFPNLGLWKQGRWTVGTLSYTSGGIVILFLWLLWGDFAWSMRDRSIWPLASWYLDHIGVSKMLFGLLMSSFPALIGLVLGPIISVKSDRHRGKWGRRIPFLLVTTPMAALGMIGLAMTPLMAKWLHRLGQPEHPLGSQLHASLGALPAGAHFLALIENEFFVSVFCFAIFWAAFELATIAGTAVFGGLINDVVPASLLGRFYGLFRSVSLIDGMIFNFYIMGQVPGHFTLILTLIGIFYGSAFLWVCLKVKEGSYPPSPPIPAATSSPLASFYAGTKMYLQECFTQPYYLWVFAMMMFATVAFIPVNVFSIPYAKQVGVSMDTLGKFFTLTYLISLLLAYPLGWLADRFHPLRVSIAALTGYVLVAGWGYFFATAQTNFLIATVLHGVFSGAYFTSAASLAQRLFPRDRFAQFASAAGILAAPASMALAPIVGAFVDSTGNDYRCTFASGCILALLALVTSSQVIGKFMKLGGPSNYRAP